MAATEPRTPILLDTPSALRLVSAFFPTEWATTEVSAVHTKQITGGLVNSLQLIWRDTAPATTSIEPTVILIRHFGQSGLIEEPPSTSTTLSAAQQAIAHWEMSRRGWGPPVYGFFAGGRLEEWYADAHTLTAAEAGLEGVRSGVARGYARLHSLRLPLRRDGFQLIFREFVEGVQKKRADVVRRLREVGNAAAERHAGVFERTDWVAEMEWVAGLFEKHGCKITVTHGDTNFLNVLVRPDSSSSNDNDNDNDNRIVLIDYETVSYSYRGFDIGGHFSERMYCYSQPDSQLTGYTAPDFEEQRTFCEAYLRELRGLRAAEHDDTVEQLLLFLH